MDRLTLALLAIAAIAGMFLWAALRLAHEPDPTEDWSDYAPPQNPHGSFSKADGGGRSHGAGGTR
jgi:hypothetical protein